MEIRGYVENDLEKLINIFHDTVHNVNVNDYTREQVDAWAPDSIDKKTWNKTLSEHHTFVAVNNDVIIGFGDIDDSGYLDRLYVHHDYLRQGVATLICDKLESMIDSDLTIITHASISAKPFFEKRGYKVVKEQIVERNGVFLKNYIMERYKVMKRPNYISVISKAVLGIIAGLLLFVTACSSGDKYIVYQYDNGDDYFSEGLQRIVDKDGKIGFRDSIGKIVIPPRYAFAFPFKEGYAKVTDTGHREAVDQHGEYHQWISDSWYYIDKTGTKHPELIKIIGQIEYTVDSTTCSKDTVGNAAGNIIETYTDLNDGSTLTIDNRTNSGSSSVKISLFRLTDIDDGIGKMLDGALTFTATDAAGQPIGGRITFDGDTAHLTFTESTWEYLPEGTAYSFVRGVKVDYQPANPIGGRTYTGSGKGGGLATNVTIKFDKNGRCQCTSDFYQAFTRPITVDGTYSIRYDIAEVRCQPAGFDAPIEWNFEIVDDGQELGFNISDASEEGSIGTDWLQLKVK